MRTKPLATKACCSSPANAGDVSLDDHERGLIPSEELASYEQMRIVKCLHCDTLSVSPSRIIGQLVWQDGRQVFRRKGEIAIES